MFTYLHFFDRIKFFTVVVDKSKKKVSFESITIVYLTFLCVCNFLDIHRNEFGVYFNIFLLCLFEKFEFLVFFSY